MKDDDRECARLGEIEQIGRRRGVPAPAMGAKAPKSH
jgi:hypothetical protein